jgi:Ca2+-binding EF-hand superfamily protein
MKHTWLIWALAAIWAFPVTDGLAEETARDRLRKRMQSREKVDTDGDQAISAEEATAAYTKNQARREEAFKKLDANKDGKLSPAEFDEPKTFKKMDASGDGFVSKAEFMAAADQLATVAFQKVDTNRDGQITADEAQKAAEKGRKSFWSRFRK